MPDEPQGIQDGGKPGAEASQVSLVPNIVVVPSVRKDTVNGRNITELEDFTDNLKHYPKSRNGRLARHSESRRSASQVSVELGVVKTAQVLEPNKANSLLRGAGANPGKLQSDNSGSVQKNNRSDSDHNSSRSPPNNGCAGLNADSYDTNMFEKTSCISSVNLSESSSDASQFDKNLKTAGAKAEDSLSRGLPEFQDVTSSINQSRDSIDVRWANEDDRDSDQRSMLSRQTVKEGLCCCYKATHRACLHCVEETPYMVSGLVLALVFSLVIVIVLAVTRVRYTQKPSRCAHHT